MELFGHHFDGLDLLALFVLFLAAIKVSAFYGRAFGDATGCPVPYNPTVGECLHCDYAVTCVAQGFWIRRAIRDLDDEG